MSSLQRDPRLAERIKRLRTVPGVRPITALTWALEMGDVGRFRSIRQAISNCGLCGDERSSADKVIRTPLSKQRNKHIQRVLVEAAKLAPRETISWLSYRINSDAGNSHFTGNNKLAANQWQPITTKMATPKKPEIVKASTDLKLSL